MERFAHYRIPFQGIGKGIHPFDFEVDRDFFSAFEFSLIKDGTFKVHLDAEKKTDHTLLAFDFKGSFATYCDRCADELDYPIQGKATVIVKFGEPQNSDEEIWYIDPKTSQLSLHDLIYEIITVHVPMIKKCKDVNGKKCNAAALKAIENEGSQTTDTLGIWDALKQINID